MASRDEQSNSFLNSDAIGDDFFIEIVESKLKIPRDEFKLRLILLSPATGKNENYASVVYRAKIKIEILRTKERKSVDVVIKALLSLMKEIKEFSVFPRERFIYENVLSSFELIWRERAKEEIKFGPRSVKFETDPYEIIVLDDLQAEGYAMLNRKVGLNMSQTKLLLTKLAKFHAASAIRHQKDGVIQKYLDRKASMPPMPDDSPFVEGFFKMFKAFVDAVKNYGDCEVYSDKLATWDKKKLMSIILDAAEPMRCGFQILNHGDIWINNMMFKTDEQNNALDVSMIDYQGPFWGSPANDILYFLLTSVSDDIKVDHFDDFVDYYHEQLTAALRKLNFDQHIPTLTELHIELLEKGAIACTCMMFILFVVKYDSSEEINIEMIMASGDNPEMINRIYNNDNYKKALKLWLPFLNKRGFLDTMIAADAKVDEKKEE